MKYFNVLSGWWRLLSFLGVDPAMSYMEVKRVQMVNLIALTCVPCMFFFAGVNIFEGRISLALVNTINGLFCLSVVVLQYYRRYQLAKIILLGLSFCFFYVGALFYGNAGENFLLCIMIVCMLLYDSRVVQWSVGALVIIGIVSVKLFTGSYLRVDHVPQSRIMVNTIGSLLFIVIAVHFFKNIIYNNMQLIEAQRRKLQRLNQEKEKIFSIVAHDVRAPLSTLDGMVYLFRQQMLDGDLSESYLIQLQQQIAQQKDALDDILYWSSRSIRGTSTNVMSTDVAKIVQTAMSHFAAACAGKQLKIQADIKPDDRVLVDPDHLMIMVRNLISNAVKFSYHDGLIEIYTSRDMDYGYLHVRDYGVGMTEEQKRVLFHTIQQRSVGTKQEPGAGIGLLLCNELIVQNGGQVTIESTLGNGSLFTVGFPLVLDPISVKMVSEHAE